MMCFAAASMPVLASAGATVRSILLLCLTVVSSVVGDLSMKHGLNSAGEFNLGLRKLSRSIARAFGSSWVWLGLGGMLASFFSLLLLLSAAPASSVFPATAGTYVLDTLGARFVLGERVTSARWTGALLVAIGVALVAR